MAFQGLEWTTNMFGLEPKWTLEPNLEAAKQVVKSLGIMDSTMKLSFLAQGAFNKLYGISVSKDVEVLILRIALPVEPRFKTLSEVATIDWVSRNTNVPVPRVIAFETSRANPIGFEWIIMTKLPGKPLANVWRSLSYPAKAGLTKRFAEYSSRIFRNQLSGIGNIYSASPPKVDRIVSMHFFWGDRIHQDVRRGPFSSSRDWMDVRLALSEHDCRSTLAKYSDKGELDSDTEADLDDAQRTLKIVNRLVPLVSKILSVNVPDNEQSMLFHDDLSRHNILVDDNGALTGVVDWECVSALPLWKACYYPSFLEGSPQDTEPDQLRYEPEASGEPSDLYWEHLMEYELTTLRQVFLDEMAKLEPDWMGVFNSSALLRDLDLAVQNCDNEFVARDIKAWIEDMEAGGNDIRNLRDRIDNSLMRLLSF